MEEMDLPPPPVGAAYPRPTLERDPGSWTSLNGEWEFLYDDSLALKSPSDVTEWPFRIRVPFAPESPASKIGNTAFHPCCWYRRRFEVPPGEGPLLLHFGAVDYRARVWVNGRFVIEHEGGFTPFHADISPYLVEGKEQEIVVRAEDDPHDLCKPRGKQDWQADPHSIWYPRTTGIWQTVWLERVPDVYLSTLRWTPHLDTWEIGLEAILEAGHMEELELEVRLSVGGHPLAQDRYRVLGHEVRRRIALSDPGTDDSRSEMLWTPERPNLIQAELTLYRRNEVVDRVRSYTALRSVGIHRDRFLLNGRPYYLRMVLDQGYWPETLMTAPSDDALRSDIYLVKRMGFNGVRKHQKIEDPRYLYWADVLGLLVWEEMPSAYRFSHHSVERLTREWADVIERDISHPCIVCWVPFNES